MDCPSCGKPGLRGKFCPECGTRLPQPGPPAVAASSMQQLQHRAVANPPARTLAGLNKPITTKRGQNIKQAMDDLADEVYGAENPTPVRPDQLRSNQNRAFDGGPYCKPVYEYSTIGQGYTTGPSNEQGDLYDASERNILCLDVLGDECVAGGTDHGLRVYDLKRKREMKNLYTKKFGHTDWVTSCAYLADGRIISAAQDSKLCLWQKAGVRCTDLTGHTGSISQVQAHGDVAISCSYDRTLKIWSCGGGGTCVGTLSGHKKPVMEFLWAQSTLVSGDRGGAVRAWDPATATCVGTLAAEGDRDRGQCSALGWYFGDDANVVMAGDQTGRVRVWDLRIGPNAVREAMLHPGGAVTGIKSTPNYIVTCGADKAIQIVDPMSANIVHSITTHKDFIYSLETIGDKVLSGDGQGWLLCHDTHDGTCHYGLGANKAAVRCIKPLPHRMVATGDDGSVVSYDM